MIQFLCWFVERCMHLAICALPDTVSWKGCLLCPNSASFNLKLILPQVCSKGFSSRSRSFLGISSDHFLSCHWWIATERLYLLLFKSYLCFPRNCLLLKWRLRHAKRLVHVQPGDRTLSKDVANINVPPCRWVFAWWEGVKGRGLAGARSRC